MGEQEREHVAPQEARDAAEFVALLRKLKERSGLSFRQLEECAAARGEVLPRSTLADVLRHGALPRVETLVVFLRACGEEQNTEAWLESRHRIVAAGVPRARTAQEDGVGPEPGHQSAHRSAHEPLRDAPLPAAELLPLAAHKSHAGQESPAAGAAKPWTSRWPGRLLGSHKRLLGAALALLALLGGGYFTLAATDYGKEKPGAARDSASPVAGTYRIRSLVSSLCLSERDGDEAGYVYQADCGSSSPTYALEEQGEGVYRIRSLHPVFGYGCLGVDNGSTKKGARMMDDYCGHRGNSERFRLKPAGANDYRLLPLHTNACVSVPGASKDTWAPVLQLPCGSGDAGQVFRFEPAPSPSAVPTITSNE
ncbi:XRE family transcriptional regulator [Streptomyces montanus]|uniref:XRE family transcriptional regulator n=1 Tax=Streptomyces montanus TaxID=2580423 RepID=A0A5R9FTZ9_9ACTN|nr:RICIN domain-containing protein [Streptomyces montanus]TLS45370.1 XRE family transcriptional regulator [Streptomyces montanus]